MSTNPVRSPIQGAAAPLPISRQENPITGFSTGSCFLWLHDKNVALEMNMRGIVNHEYNRLLAEKAFAHGVETNRRPLPEHTAVARILCIKLAVAVAQTDYKSAASFLPEDVSIRLAPAADSRLYNLG